MLKAEQNTVVTLVKSLLEHSKNSNKLVFCISEFSDTLHFFIEL